METVTLAAVFSYNHAKYILAAILVNLFVYEILIVNYHYFFNYQACRWYVFTTEKHIMVQLAKI
jgi:hypothetical protein